MATTTPQQALPIPQSTDDPDIVADISAFPVSRGTSSN